MDLLTVGLTGIVALIVILILSALPLYFAVNILGGDASILKVLLVNLIVAIIGIAINSNITAFILLLFIYKEVFKLSWISAFLAWLLQFVIALVLVGIAIILGLGIAIV